MISQQRPLAQPSPADKDLMVYTAVLQGNLEQLFEKGHEHAVKTALPGVNDGSVGDIALVDDGTNKYIVIKFQDGWFRSAALTAV